MSDMGWEWVEDLLCLFVVGRLVQILRVLHDWLNLKILEVTHESSKCWVVRNPSYWMMRLISAKPERKVIWFATDEFAENVQSLTNVKDLEVPYVTPQMASVAHTLPKLRVLTLQIMPYGLMFPPNVECITFLDVYHGNWEDLSKFKHLRKLRITGPLTDGFQVPQTVKSLEVDDCDNVDLLYELLKDRKYAIERLIVDLDQSQNAIQLFKLPFLRTLDILGEVYIHPTEQCLENARITKCNVHPTMAERNARMHQRASDAAIYTLLCCPLYKDLRIMIAKMVYASRFEISTWI